MTWLWQQFPNILCALGSVCFLVAMVINIVRTS